MFSSWLLWHLAFLAANLRLKKTGKNDRKINMLKAASEQAKEEEKHESPIFEEMNIATTKPQKGADCADPPSVT